MTIVQIQITEVSDGNVEITVREAHTTTATPREADYSKKFCRTLVKMIPEIGKELGAQKAIALPHDRKAN